MISGKNSNSNLITCENGIFQKTHVDVRYSLFCDFRMLHQTHKTLYLI